jgi:hypothetical protein
MPEYGQALPNGHKNPADKPVLLQNVPAAHGALIFSPIFVQN